VKRAGALILGAVLAFAARASFAGDYNGLVLEQIKQMPQGGRYSVSHFAKIRLQSSAHFESGKFFILILYSSEHSRLYEREVSFNSTTLLWSI